MTSALARFRLDDGRTAPFSPSAPVKLVVCLGCILLVSLARNPVFVLVMLAGTITRTALLPRKVLPRVVAGALAAAGLNLALMLPAVLIGQPQAAVTLATKALVCTGITLIMALTTPAAQLTGALRLVRLPGIVIMTIDLALRSIVRLGETAEEVLSALRLRSVGHNDRKQATLGGVGGVVLLKAGRAAQDTYDAMQCRGFDGSYHEAPRAQRFRLQDLFWLLLLAGLIALFVHLEGMV